MFHLLEKIRTQSSRPQRTFIAFSISLLFTGLVFVVWLTKEQYAPEKVSEDIPVVQNIASNTPTDTLVKNMRDMWGSLIGASQELGDTLKNVDFSSTVQYTSSTTSPTPQQN